MQVLEEAEGFNFLIHGRTVQKKFKFIQNDSHCSRVLQHEKKSEICEKLEQISLH